MEERDAASECPHHDDDQSVYRSDSPESHDAIFDFDAAVEEHDQTDKGDDGSTPRSGCRNTIITAAAVIRSGFSS